MHNTTILLSHLHDDDTDFSSHLSKLTLARGSHDVVGMGLFR